MTLELSEISDPSFARDLQSAGVPLEAVSALMVYPAIHTAWSDGSIAGWEDAGVWAAVKLAGLESPQARWLVQRWLTKRPEHEEALLDLTWRLYECLPSLQQRFGTDLSFASARTVARCSGGLLGFFAISEAEQEALDQLERYFDGKGLATTRRRALNWSRDLEATLPGLRLVAPDDVDAADDAPLEGPLVSGLSAIETAPYMRELSVEVDLLSRDERRKIARQVKREGSKGLLPPVRAAYESLTEDERALVGHPRSLQAITPWQACRLALLLVCRSARAHTESVGADELLKARDAGDDALFDALYAKVRVQAAAMVAHDRAPSAQLLRNLLKADDVAFVCRHYVRMACAAYRALKTTSPSLRSTFLIPLFGVHDVRVRQGHAWCLFIDAPRGVACPLDPSAADVHWESGHAESFLNPYLPALDYANVTALLTRLLTCDKPAGARGAEWLVERLPAESRRPLAARLLAQWPLSDVLTEQELTSLLTATRDAGAPEALLQRIEDMHTESRDVLNPNRSGPIRQRLARLLVASGLVTQTSLPATLR